MVLGQGFCFRSKHQFISAWFFTTTISLDDSLNCLWIHNRYNPVLSSIAQYRLLIFYLQGLFNAHKKFPTQITRNMTQGHLATYRSTGLVCLQSAIKMQSLLTLTNTISIPQKKRSTVSFIVLFKHASC